MGWKITKRNLLLISGSVLLLINCSIKLALILSSYDEWKGTLFRKIIVYSIIDSIIFIVISAGLIYYCANGFEINFSKSDKTDSPGEWVDSNGVKWRRTNGGGLFWWDGQDWKIH
tara:strand:+ start:444 stop:788 length:345 start_codon:yes stop_codon:yes gene_type:complete